MATFMIFGLAGMCAWYIAKIFFTGMEPSRYGPDIDLRNRPANRITSIAIYGALMIFALWAGCLIYSKP